MQARFCFTVEGTAARIARKEMTQYAQPIKGLGPIQKEFTDFMEYLSLQPVYEILGIAAELQLDPQVGAVVL